ncbi:MAG: M20/M25/M40 family metallo-hydrolase [Candidatus Aminicenantes bacterium]|jgi:acetylornithine deacetylase
MEKARYSKGKRSGIKPKRLKSLLKKLINIYSPYGKEEEIGTFLYHYLKEHGLPVLRQPVQGERVNLLVIPENTEPLLVLVGHIDTIPAPDLEDYKYKAKGKHRDKIFGLGAADMKAGCAAMIEAYICQWQVFQHRVPAALALVVGEEDLGDGAEQFLNEYHFPYAVVGEPTDLIPCFSHYGYIEANISTRGKRIHASLAHEGVNAIESMLRLILKIIDYLKSKRQDIVYNVRDLASSPSGFEVPEQCELWLDLHLPPHSAIEAVVHELEELVFNEGRENPQLNAVLQFSYLHSGYQLPEKGEIYNRLKSVYEKLSLPFAPDSFRSHSDANQFWEAGIRPILLGPGQLQHAHMPEEFVSFPQVLSAAEIYYSLLQPLTRHTGTQL